MIETHEQHVVYNCCIAQKTGTEKEVRFGQITTLKSHSLTFL